MSGYKLAVWKGNNRVEVMERSIPEPGPGEVLLKVRVGGICGTDLHIISGAHPQVSPPLVPGHEFAGEVADTGKGVDHSLRGLRAGSDSYLGCGECGYCRSGHAQLCDRGTCELGVNVDGGWAEYVIVPARNLYILPEAVSFADAGAGCILNCPLAAVEKVTIKPGDRVLIIGDGPSSLVMLQLVRLKGAAEVMVAGHRERRLSLAGELGADFVVNTHKTELGDVVKKLIGEPQVVIDAVGKAETLASALLLAGREGRVHLFGLPEGPLGNLPVDMLLWKELTITGSTGVPSLWQTAVDYLSRGLLTIAPIVSHRFSLEEAPEALAFIRNNPQDVIKAVFVMHG